MMWFHAGGGNANGDCSKLTSDLANTEPFIAVYTEAFPMCSKPALLGLRPGG